ncbi:MAG: hypothetical protein PVI18_08970, partial [Desulfobacterales bacterium]
KSLLKYRTFIGPHVGFEYQKKTRYGRQCKLFCPAAGHDPKIGELWELICRSVLLEFLDRR